MSSTRLGATNWATIDLWPDEEPLLTRACISAEHNGDVDPIWFAPDDPRVAV